MHWIDVVLLIPLLFGVYKGFKNGLIKELISLFSFVIGLIIAIKFSSITHDLLLENRWIPEQYLPMASFIITFLAIIILLNIFGRVIEKVIKIVLLSFINKLLGAGFGALKFLILIGALITFIDKVNEKFSLIEEAVLSQSVLYNSILELSIVVTPVFKSFL